MARVGPDFNSTRQNTAPQHRGHPVIRVIEQAARAHAQAEKQKAQFRSALTALVAQTLAQQIQQPPPPAGAQALAQVPQQMGPQLVGSAPMRQATPQQRPRQSPINRLAAGPSIYSRLARRPTWQNF